MVDDGEVSSSLPQQDPNNTRISDNNNNDENIKVQNPNIINDDDNESIQHPLNRIDHRPNRGPLLSLLWSKKEEELSGQTLYLGGEIGVDGKIYCIPGHAPRVLVIDPDTDTIYPIGPPNEELTSNGRKFKWLRGIPVGDVIYGLPCHASEVLRIHVPTQTITKLSIPYEEFYDDKTNAKEQREMVWKYHGGSISPLDHCIYAIPQSASHVLKIDPTTDTCSFVGPELEGKYKWYGGVVGKQDGAIYGIPHNASSILRITPTRISVHGDFGTGGHKWHGAAAATNGVIVSVPANADTVLCITPGNPDPQWTEIGNTNIIQTGRHRTDRKYKYLGAMVGPNGKVYAFPSGSEYVLQVDAVSMTVKTVGPNLRDMDMERVVQNKWQNGLTCYNNNCVYAMPLAGTTILRIDCSKSMNQKDDENEDPEITTWNLPSPYKTRDKWEGGVILPNGIMYTIPNNHKAVLRIEPYNLKQTSSNINNNGGVKGPNDTIQQQQQPSEPRDLESKPMNGTSTSTSSSKKNNKDQSKKYIGTRQEYGGNDESLTYRSGIPTLRSSSHRVKFSIKNRKHDPNPKDRNGQETKTTWLPPSITAEDVFDYDAIKYNLAGAIASMLQQCDPDIVGTFVTKQQQQQESSSKLEEFRVPVPSVWRSVNGGCCEDAQKYLSETFASDENFMTLFDQFVEESALPYLKQRLVATGAVEHDDPITFYYQRPPTLRLQPGPAWAKVKPHNDAEYGHQNGELNFWIPLTDRELTGVDLWCESKFQANDYHPIPAGVGQVISFHGSSCRHYVTANESENTRVSLDFRVGVQGFFDPYWQMKGTTDDHGRQEVIL